MIVTESVRLNDVNSIADMVAKHQKARAWEKIKDDLIASEKSIKEEGTISSEKMRQELGI